MKLDQNPLRLTPWWFDTSPVTGINFDNILDRPSNAIITPFPAERLDGLCQFYVTLGSATAYEANAEIETSIIQFVETYIAGPNKQLDLTGHSQGDGACVVAAIYFAGYTLLTIPVAVPPTMLSE